MAQLAAADAGGVKDFEDGAVAQAERGGHVRHGEHTLDLGRAEDDLGQAMLGAGHFEIGGGILGQVPMPDEPAEETDDGREPLALGAGGQRLAIALAVLVKVNLITVNRFPPDATGLVNFPAFTELPEVAQLLELADSLFRGAAVARRRAACLPFFSRQRDGSGSRREELTKEDKQLILSPIVVWFPTTFLRNYAVPLKHSFATRARRR